MCKHLCCFVKSLYFRNKYLLSIIMFANIIAALLFSYSDGRSWTTWGIEIWEAIASGNPRDYYLISAKNLIGAPHGGSMNYTFDLLPWAIWNIPLWIAYNIGWDIFSPIGIFWSKFFFYICSIIVVYYASKIMKFFNVDDSFIDKYTLVFLGSTTLMISVAAMGQDELYYVCTFVVGMYYWLLNKKKFYIFWALSASACPFMFAPILCCLCIREKNLIKHFTFVVLSFIPKLLMALVFGYDTLKYLKDEYHLVPSLTSSMLMDWFFRSSVISSPYGNVSVFFFCGLLLFCYCYFKEAEEEMENNRRAVIISGAFVLMMVVLCWMHVYRYVIYLPLVLLSAAVCGRRLFNIVVVLTIALEILQSFYAIVQNYCANLSSVNPCWNSIVGHSTYGNMFFFLERSQEIITKVNEVNASIIVSIGLLVVIILIFRRYVKMIDIDERIVRKIVNVYVVVPLLFICAYLFIMNVYVTNGDEFTSNGTITPKINIHNGTIGNSVALDFDMLSFVEIHPITWGNNYDDSSVAEFKIIETKNNNLIYEKKINLKDFVDNKSFVIRLDGLSINRGGEYKFILEFDSERSNSNIAFTYVNSRMETTLKSTGEKNVFRFIGKKRIV